MTRSFGDRGFRPVVVIAKPDVTTIRHTPRDHFLAVATDGFWNVLTNKEVTDPLTAHPWDSARVAARLRDVVIRHGKDNITALVLRLRGP